jgi:hypothetical protein
MRKHELGIEDLIEITEEHNSMIGWTFFLTVFPPTQCVFMFLWGCLLNFVFSAIFNVDLYDYLTNPDNPLPLLFVFFSYGLLWIFLVSKIVDKKAQKLREIVDEHCSEAMFHQAEVEMQKDIVINKENAELLYYVRAHYRKGNIDRARELFFRLCGRL